MTDDIVTRLRWKAPMGCWSDGEEAADKIESLLELNDDLAVRIDWLIKTFSSYDEDGLFAFPDGAHWSKPRG